MAYFICSQCNYGAASWMGKCPGCGEWNTLKEQKDKMDEQKKGQITPAQFFSLSRFTTSRITRFSTHILEFDRVLGGGIVPGEVILLSGEPGIGKSTLLMQSIRSLQSLYVSGEESAEQVHDRAKRVQVPTKSVLFSNEECIEKVLSGIDTLTTKPQLVIIDSVQTTYSQNVDSPPGSIAQIRTITDSIIEYAKKNTLAFLIVGHVTKDGDIAGPKTLEHMVDCVLTLEGDSESLFRILRSTKNRFGPTDEIGVFEMNETGMTEIDSADVLIEQNSDIHIGRAITGISEGNRVFFVEIQTLAVPTSFPVPRRVSKGLDYNRMLLLLAVAKKYLRLSLDSFDVYINVVGGMRIRSPLADLGVITSLYSSVLSVPVAHNYQFFGEVGLLGEIRQTKLSKKIASEAKRIGFSHSISPLNIKSITSLPQVLKKH